MIGVKGLDMPKCCYMCNFFIYSEENGILDRTKLPMCFRCCADLNLKRITSEMELTSRHKECPLVELKGENNG